jgi:CheY-like chemotaxis protein
VLIVEDNPVNRVFISTILAKMGHRVTCRCDGKQGFETWRDHHFDCILMDIQMPVMGGEDALQQIRDEEHTRGVRTRTPIIALTAHALVGDRERFLLNGFDGYLAKPVLVEELIVQMKQCINPSQRPEDTEMPCLC